MSISIGGIDIANAILNLEFELGRTQRILEWIVNNNPNLRGPGQADMVKIADDSVETLQKKYPEAGIEKAAR